MTSFNSVHLQYSLHFTNCCPTHVEQFGCVHGSYHTVKYNVEPLKNSRILFFFFLQGKGRETRSFVWQVPDEGAPVWNWALKMTLHLRKCVWVSRRAIWSFINMQQPCFFQPNICSAVVLFIEKQMQFDTMRLIIHNLPSASYLDGLCHPSAFYFAISLYFYNDSCQSSNAGHSPAVNMYVVTPTYSTSPMHKRFVHNQAQRKPILSCSNGGV